MKRVFIILSAIILSVASMAQVPTIDSLHRAVNRFVTTSATTAFLEMRLNRILHGILFRIDSASGGSGGAAGIDTLYAINDSTLRYRKNGITYNFNLNGVYDSRRKVDTLFALNDSTLRFTINGQSRDLLIRGNSTGGGGSSEEAIDANSLVRANSKLFSKTPVFTTYASMRSVATADLQSGAVYFTNIGGIVRQWLYDAADASTADDTAMVIVTAGGKRFKAVVDDGWINAKWFGATGNGSTDDTYNLQRWINYTIRNMGTYSKMYLPRGRYKISNGLVILKDANGDGTPEFVTVEMKGDAFSYGLSGSMASSVIYASHKDNFALAIQWGKGCRISNIGLDGENQISSLTQSQIYSGDKTLFFGSGVRTNNKSPYAGFVVDPFHATPASLDKYPRMETYYNALPNTGTTGSTDVIFDNIYVEKFVVGVIFSPNGTSQNAEACVISNAWIQNCADAISNAQSQTRTNQVKNLKVWGRVHTIFNQSSWGQGTGVAPYVYDVNIADYNYQLLNLTAGWSGASFINVYSELLFRLGSWGAGVGGLPVSFVNCYFDIPTAGYYTSSKFIFNEAVFTGCTIRQYNGKTGYITAGGNRLTFINCMLSGPVIPYRDVTNLPQANIWSARVKYINCTTYGLPIPGSTGMITSELFESSLRNNPYTYPIYGVQTAKVKPLIFGDPVRSSDRSNLPLTYEYGIGGELQLVSLRATNDAGRTVDFNANGTARFTSANASSYLVNDLLMQQGITSTIDGETGIPSTILGVVTSIVADTVFVGSVPDINPTSVQKTGVTIYVYHHAEFMEPVVGNITSGSNVITNIHYHSRLANMRPGAPVLHPSFPYYTRVTAIDRIGKTITVSKNATATEAQAVIEFTRLRGEGTAIQNPSTIDFAGFVNFDTAAALILKGSFIENSGTDTTIRGWRCSKTGFLNSTMPPEFKTEYFHDTRYPDPIGYSPSLELTALTDSDFVTKKHLLDQITAIPEAVMDPNTMQGAGTGISPYGPDTTNWIATKTDIATAVGIGLTAVAHDITLLGSGTVPDPLKVDTTRMATLARLYHVADSLDLLSGGTADGSETIIVDGVGYTVAGTGTAADPYTFTIVGAPATNPFKAITIESYGGNPNAVASGSTYTGTDNTPALEAALTAAASGQYLIIPSGEWGFFTPVDTIKGPKWVNMLVIGNIRLNGNDWLRVTNGSGGYEQHRIIVWGEITGRANQPAFNYTNWLAGTGPDFTTHNNVAVTIYNTNQQYIEINKASGLASPVKIVGGNPPGNTSGNGSQENTVIGRWWLANRFGIWLTSNNGISWNDKNYFGGPQGGTLRIGAQYPIYIDGYNAPALSNGETNNGAFRSNRFEFMLELSEFLPVCNGDITEPEFSITVEGGTTTGVLDPTCTWEMLSTGPNVVRSPIYRGRGVFGSQRLGSGSTGKMGINGTIETPIWNGGAYYGKRADIDGTGNIIVHTPPTTTQATRNGAQAYIKFVNMPEARSHVNITAATYTVATGVSDVFYNHVTGTVTLPSAASWPNREIKIYNTHGTGYLTVNKAGSGFDHILPGKANVYFAINSTWVSYGDGVGTGGAMGTGQKVTDANVTVAPTDHAVIVYNQTADRTVTMPSAAAYPGRVLTIVQSDGNGHTLNLTENFNSNGALFGVLLNNNRVMLQSIGGVWECIMSQL
jgi:hypothetical protein